MRSSRGPSRVFKNTDCTSTPLTGPAKREAGRAPGFPGEGSMGGATVRGIIEGAAADSSTCRKRALSAENF
ncbi:protein of unknown function [Ruminococcaceae bacterium BL-6]|nr:protein of unknown function [Ruminococcaceae bacterium BL-6]